MSGLTPLPLPVTPLSIKDLPDDELRARVKEADTFGVKLLDFLVDAGELGILAEYLDNFEEESRD